MSFTKKTGLSDHCIVTYYCIFLIITKLTHLPTVKKYAVGILEAKSSCAHCVTRNVASGNSTQHVTPHG